MPFHNKHYIIVNEDGLITDAWSNGPYPGRDTTNAICINEQGGYQFALPETSEENPLLMLFPYRIYRFRYDATTGKITERPQSEIDAEIALIPPAPPSAQEQLRADVDFLAAMQGVSL